MKASDIVLSAALVPVLTATFCAASISMAAAAESAPVVIPMHALNGSREDGSATLMQVSDGVRVVVTLAQATTSNEQPT